MLGTEDLAQAKATLRREASKRRARVDRKQSEIAANTLAERFCVTQQENLPHSIVAIYWPIRNEIDVRPLMDLLRMKRVCAVLPTMAGPGNPLIFRRWAPGDMLVDAGFGVKEPLPSAPVITPDVIILPLLAFDAGCNRLGYGAGYYDSTLAALRREHKILAVGVAYDEQELPKIPVNCHDQCLDVVLTESRELTPPK
ncbi:MAG: 5-formyltetrahydrofolate cyclo-ligase [Pseudomonadota bacterium]|nr:5-formyltetrahydrofolate cyclo-ligase [Pseudomonadota bacterium]